MNRSTGKTVYELIKELKGGFNAFLWNVKGNVADIDLKKGNTIRTNTEMMNIWKVY